MADPTPQADGAPLPPEDTETGRAKHVAPTDGEGPGVAVAATGRDAATPRETSVEPATPAVAASTPAEDEAAGARAEADAARADAGAARTDADAAHADTRTERLDREDDRTAVLPADERRPGEDRTAVLPADRAPAPPAPREAPTPLPAADAPPPPRRRNNRLVGTAWVLLAALVFEVLYLAAFALVVLVVAGPANVGLSMQQLVSTPFAWLPVVLFALFYELTVLLLNRAGRFAYVLSSLIVAAIVYVLSAVLILAMQEGGISNEGNLGRALIAPQVVLIPIIAREVMLWTGLAVGARGRRVRRRNREAQEAYERERFASSVRGSDDGARAGA